MIQYNMIPCNIVLAIIYNMMLVQDNIIYYTILDYTIVCYTRLYYNIL